MKNIPTPCKSEVEKYLKRWNSLENYVLQEKSLYKLFHKTYPRNIDIDDILIKASSLNDFYSTNIFSIFPVAKHILNLNIDDRLKRGDISLVKDIMNVKIGGKEKRFYSFATKYCSHHNPDDFPIYDNFVERVLLHFKSKDKFDKFTAKDLKDYESFKTILFNFRTYYGLDDYKLKEIDRYLWQLGKKFFPKKYKKRGKNE